MSNDITLREVNVDDSLKLQKVAEGLHKSGLYPQLKGPAGAYAVVQYGYELGLGPMTSLQNINLIQGKPAANGQTMLSLAMSRGVTFKVEEETTESCTIEFKRGNMVYRSTFTVEDAKRAGLTGKDNWKKWPSEMLYWRAVAKGIRRIAPDAVMGLYTPDELTNGEMVNVTPQAQSEDTSKEENEVTYANNNQLRALATILGKLGFESNDQKRQAINFWLKSRGEEEVNSSRKLTKTQASEAIDVFKEELENLIETEDAEPTEVEYEEANE